VPYRSIEDPAKLRRVLEAILLIEGDLELSSLLRHVVTEAQSITNARYGALGVLNHDGTSLSEFVTVGMDVEQEEAIGARPTGRGVLGLLINEPRAMRSSHLQNLESSFGFPPNHPPMTSFLSVPIRVRDEVYGNLYLTDKIGWSEFTSDDEALIGALALAAGIAIENARLHSQVQEVAVYEERDRLARDLHDTVIQRLFAVGLSLQSLQANPSADRAVDQLSRTIDDIDDTIRQIRMSIFALQSDGTGQGTRDQVLTLLAELRPMVGFDVGATLEGPIDTAVSPDLRANLLAVIREAITNVGRHAGASAARVSVVISDQDCLLQIVDDGRGLSTDPPSPGGLGLGNLRSRASKLGGECTVGTAPGGGTELVWRVPMIA
jgi:signal transduction histidine kinase